MKGLALTKPAFLIGMLLLAAFLPQFPPIFGRSEIHVNVFFLCAASLVIILWVSSLPRRYLIIAGAYFGVLQILLLLSYIMGSEGISSLGELPSLLRPLMLFIITLSFSILLHHDRAYDACISASIFLTIVSFFYAMFEVFAFDLVSGVIHLLYRLPDKSHIDGVSVSFFTLPYYAAYVHSILMLFVLAGLSLRPSIFLGVVFIMSVINIVLTQSKTGIFVIFLSLFLYWFASVSLKQRFLVMLLAIAVCAAMMHFLYDIVKYLNKGIGGNFAYTTLMMLDRPDEVGNLAERNRQVAQTFDALEESGWFFGVGVGKGVLIESWIAYVPYRYGLLGMVLFTLFYLFVSMRSLYQGARLNVRADKVMARVVGVWSISIFFSQLSALSMEVSKASVYTALMLALASSLMIKKPENIKANPPKECDA